MNNMDESMGTVDEPLGSSTRGGFLTKATIDRRMMLKAAVATGVVAGTWVAPRIQTLGFAPAAASHTICVITNPAQDDLNSNQNNNTYVSGVLSPNDVGYTRCPGNQSMSYGSSANAVDTITFVFPQAQFPNNPCDQVRVKTVPADCNNTHTDRFNPDLTGFAVVIDPTGTVGTCDCTVVEVVIFASNRSAILETFDTPFMESCGTGVLVELRCDIEDNPPQADTRMAVRISCSHFETCPTPTV